MQVAGLVSTAVLMTERRSTAGIRGFARSVAAVPRTIADGVGLLRRSRVLLALVSVELFWGFGMVCFESLTPVRLAEVVGGNEAAAAITGPVVAVAWIASAGGSAVTPLLTRWLGIAPTAALMRVLQGVTVAGMGFFAGVGGIIAAYIACYTVHGTSNAAHMTLLHRQAEDRVRATVVSLNSWVSQPASAVGVIVADRVSAGDERLDGHVCRGDRPRRGGTALPAGLATVANGRRGCLHPERRSNSTPRRRALEWANIDVGRTSRLATRWGVR